MIKLFYCQTLVSAAEMLYQLTVRIFRIDVSVDVEDFKLLNVKVL